MKDRARSIGVFMDIVLVSYVCNIISVMYHLTRHTQTCTHTHTPLLIHCTFYLDISRVDNALSCGFLRLLLCILNQSLCIFKNKFLLPIEECKMMSILCKAIYIYIYVSFLKRLCRRVCQEEINLPKVTFPHG